MQQISTTRMDGFTQDAAFPVYVLMKDCGDVMKFSSREAMQQDLEPTDIENGEYAAWDRNGSVLTLSVSKPKSVWLKIVNSGNRVSEPELAVLRAKAEAQAGPDAIFNKLRRKLGRAKG